MAYDQIEVEIKVSIDERTFDRLLTRLKETTRFVKSSHQVDEYYSPRDKPYISHQYPFEWLSIRKRDTNTLLNYKHFHPEGAEKHTHCDEYESIISDPEMFEKILESIGFVKLVTVDKTRYVFSVHDEFEISLDYVESLGHFVEIEALTNRGSIEATRRALDELVEDLGLDHANVDYRGYPYQLLRQRGKI